MTTQKIESEKTRGLIEGQFVSGAELLETLFPPKSRPTLRWLRDQCDERRVRFVKIGRLVFFNPQQVSEDWRDRFTVGAVKGGAK